MILYHSSSLLRSVSFLFQGRGSKLISIIVAETVFDEWMKAIENDILPKQFREQFLEKYDGAGVMTSNGSSELSDDSSLKSRPSLPARVSRKEKLIEGQTTPSAIVQPQLGH